MQVENAVEKVKAASGGCGCSEREYLYILEQIKSAGWYLIFGLGHDSPLYVNGTDAASEIFFLESEQAWIDKIITKFNSECLASKRNVPRIINAQYNTTVKDSFEMVGAADHKILFMYELDCISGLHDSMDFIFVDAPKGCSQQSPGRIKSIYTAALIGRQAGCKVMIHDADRPLERACCEKFLEPFFFCSERLDNSWIFKP